MTFILCGVGIGYEKDGKGCLKQPLPSSAHAPYASILSEEECF